MGDRPISQMEIEAVLERTFNWLELPGRFWSKVGISNESGCWPWVGSHTKAGYGNVWMNGRVVLAHRVSYEHFVGPVPDGLQIDHLCRNRACINPHHLEAVTQAENIARGEGASAVNARKVECVHGHPLSGDNLYTNPNGKRECRTCRRARWKRWSA